VVLPHAQAARLNQQITDAERKQAEYTRNAQTCAVAFQQVRCACFLPPWQCGCSWDWCCVLFRLLQRAWTYLPLIEALSNPQSMAHADCSKQGNMLTCACHRLDWVT